MQLTPNTQIHHTQTQTHKRRSSNKRPLNEMLSLRIVKGGAEFYFA